MTIAATLDRRRTDRNAGVNTALTKSLKPGLTLLPHNRARDGEKRFEFDARS